MPARWRQRWTGRACLRAALACTLACAGIGGCSRVHYSYRQAHYDPCGAQAVKRVAVVGWSPQEQSGLGEVLAAVAADLIKLRKNYLVVGQNSGYAGRWSMACTNDVQGVAVVRALEAGAQARGTAVLRASLELLRCSDGALVFRNEGTMAQKAADKSLAQLTANYEAALGAPARRFAALSFALLQQMVQQMPDPQLNDHEVEEKIELGAL